MPQIGPLEIMVVMVVALLVFGPEKLPEMARNLGRTASQLRRMAQDMKDDFSTALDDDEEEDRPAPGAGSSRPRAAGALPGDDDSSADSSGRANEPTGPDSAEDTIAGGSDAGDDRPTLHDATADGSDAVREEDEGSSVQGSAKGGSQATLEDDESDSITNDLERLNRHQQDAEAASAPAGDSKVERSE